MITCIDSVINSKRAKRGKKFHAKTTKKIFFDTHKAIYNSLLCKHQLSYDNSQTCDPTDSNKFQRHAYKG